MKKIRVYEYARQKQVTSKDVIQQLNILGEYVKGHMSSLETEIVSKLDKIFIKTSNEKTASDQHKKHSKVNYGHTGDNGKTETLPLKEGEKTVTSEQIKDANKVEINSNEKKANMDSNNSNSSNQKTELRSGRPKLKHTAYSSHRPQNKQPTAGKGNNYQPNKKMVNNRNDDSKGHKNYTPRNAENRPLDRQKGRMGEEFKRDSNYNKDRRPEHAHGAKATSSTQSGNRDRISSNKGYSQNRQPSGENRHRNYGERKDREIVKNKDQKQSQGTHTSAQNHSRNNAPVQANGNIKKPTSVAGSDAKQQTFNKKPKKATKPYTSKKSVQEKQREESKVFRNKKQVVEVVEKRMKPLPEKITFSGSLTVTELAKKLARDPAEIIKKLFMMGVVTTINSVLDKDAIEVVCLDYGVKLEEVVIIDKTDLEAVIADDDISLNTFERPAVVTIMGHVDHGKTTLLDSIRKTKVTAGEAGGITQHIGAYQVSVFDKQITFLDTPGHEAFTTMRARGAQVTDIAILVVAADDGVKPQTVEAISHAKVAGVPIIVAVNKMDKPDADVERVQSELSQYEIVAEAWGGDNIFVPISALKGTGINNLLETILLVSEVAELRCNKNRAALGTVIEAKLDKGRGAVATLLVQNGTLKVGDPIVVGNAFGKVRAMVNDIGQRVNAALPSMPVEITGLNEVPQAGDRFVVFEDEKTARSVGGKRATEHLLASRGEKAKVTLDNLFEQLQKEDIKEINLIVKADVQGSQEALVTALKKIKVDGVWVKVILSGVGAISESDVLLAASSNAIVIGFNVRPTANANKIAEMEKVDIRTHQVIYQVIKEVESAMKGLLDPEYVKKVIGKAEVRQLVKISKIGVIAGSYMLEGKIIRGCFINVIRNGNLIHEGELKTLKRFKDDVKEVTEGFECGISLQKFNEFAELDILEAYIMEEVERA